MRSVPGVLGRAWGIFGSVKPGDSGAEDSGALHRLLDEVVQVLRDSRGEAGHLEDAEDLVTRDGLHLKQGAWQAPLQTSSG